MKTVITFRKLSAWLLGLSALFFAFSTASAQKVSSYTLTTFNRAYQTIAGDGSSSFFLSGQDDLVQNGTTGFSFTYDGTQYPAGSTWSLCSNGFMGLGATVSSVPDFNSYARASAVNNVLMPFNTDLVLYYGGAYYEVSGNSPNRVMTFEWQGAIMYFNTSYQTSFQVKLYETTNVIEFCYQDLGYTFGNQNLPASGSATNSVDPAQAVIGITGNPAATDNLMSGTTTNNIPSSNLRFASLPNTQLQVLPKLINYGALLAGQSADNTVTVFHAGTAGTLTVSGATITGNPDFTVVGPLPGPLQPGQSGFFTVRFTAQGNANRAASLTVISNGRDSGAQSIALKGFTIAPNIAVDSSTRFKKTRTRLGDSLTQWVHITSIGQASLFISSFQLVGIDANQYHISHLPANPIGPGITDSVGITYSPTVEGLHQALLLINSNATNFPIDTILLRGIGTLAHIVVTPPILLFDSTREGDTICKNISIYNPGSDTLKILSNAVISDDGDFHYTGLSAADQFIPPDQTKTVGVCFIPLQQGIRQGRLELKTNIPKTYDTPRRDTAGVITVDFQGTGVPFGVLATGVSGSPVTDSALIGVKVCRTDSLKNTGDADISVTGITLAGIGGTNTSVFSYSGLPSFPFTLKAHSSMTFTVCSTPDQQGLLSGSATVNGTTSGTPINTVLALNVFGFKPCISPSPISLFDGLILPNNGSVSALCDTITNCGDIDAIYSVAISGASAADYSVTPTTSATVPAHGGTAVFCVTYKPTVTGASPASLDVSTADNSESAKIPLNGSAGCAALINTVPVVKATGDNERDTFTFVITNNGTIDWTPGNDTIVGTGASTFTVISVSPSPIPPNGQATVTVEFHPPIGSGGQTFTAQLTWPNSAPCGTIAAIDLNGVATVSSVPLVTATEGFTLEQSYPNPTQGNATFTYSTPREAEVSIAIADMTGKIIRTLITGRVSEGSHLVNFDARDLSSGTYVYLLESGSIKLVRQFILTK